MANRSRAVSRKFRTGGIDMKAGRWILIAALAVCVGFQPHADAAKADDKGDTKIIVNLWKNELY
jgi:hypothetical protein